MKRIIALIFLFSIVALWNYVPYSYHCFDYPFAGCDSWELWWNLPTDWEEYKGVRWGAYFTTNGFYTIILIIILSKIALKLENQK